MEVSSSVEDFLQKTAGACFDGISCSLSSKLFLSEYVEEMTAVSRGITMHAVAAGLCGQM